MQVCRLKAPRDATSISIAGEEYKVSDGYIEVPEMLKSIAETHGYGKAAERADIDRVARDVVTKLSAAQVAEMGRGELLIYCDENRMDVPPRTGLAALRELVWKDAEAKQKLIAKAAAAS